MKFVQNLNPLTEDFGGAQWMTVKKVVVSKAGIQYAHLKMSEVLALKKTVDMNKALVAKMTWDVVNNSDKMWVMAFKKKYV